MSGKFIVSREWSPC